MVITICVVILWGVNYLQSLVDYYALMNKLYYQEMLDIIDTIVISGDGSILDQMK